jgi:hypothetical protein
LFLLIRLAANRLPARWRGRWSEVKTAEVIALAWPARYRPGFQAAAG